MKFSTALLTTAFTSTLASTTSVLLPLYLYPSVTDRSWDPVYYSAGNFTDVDFYIIVNPDSGPGGDQYPNSDYTLGLSRLNSFPNVHLLGYVHTTFGADSASTINANVTKWANFRNFHKNNQNISISGIFFDEVNADQGHLQYYTDLSDFAYDTIGAYAADTVVVLNPGVRTALTAYYDLADLVVVYECTLAGDPTGCKAYRDQTTINEQVISGKQDQSALLVRSYTGTAAQLANSVAVAKKNDIGAFYATSALHYNNVDLLRQQVAAIGRS